MGHADLYADWRIHRAFKFSNFSPDGRWITSGSSDSIVRVWDCNTRQLIGSPLQGHTDRIPSIAVSSDGCPVSTDLVGTGLFAYGPSQQVGNGHTFLNKLLPYTNAPPPHMKSLGGNPSVVSACYSPDRTLYAVSTLDGHVSLWHIRDGLLWESDTPIHSIHHLRLSADRFVLSLCVGLGLGRRKTDRSNRYQNFWTTALYE